MYQLARQKISAKECTYKYNFTDLPWGLCHCRTIAPAHAPARYCYTAKVLGEVTLGRGEAKRTFPLAWLCTTGETAQAPQLTTQQRPSTPHPGIHRPPLCCRNLPGTFSSFHGFPLGSKAIELARQKQDIQEPGKGTACTHCSVWVPSGRIGRNRCPASSKSCTDVPFLQETERDGHPWWSPSPLLWHLSGVRGVPTRPHCAPGHGMRAMVPGWILTQGARCGRHGPGLVSAAHSHNISQYPTMRLLLATPLLRSEIKRHPTH